MSDPLAGYTPNWRNEEEDENDPLAKYTPDWRNNLQGMDRRLESSLGRRQVNAEDNQRYKEMLEKSLPLATGDRRVSIQARLDDLKNEMAVFEKGGSVLDRGRRFLGGMAESIPQMAMGITDLTAAIVQPVEHMGEYAGINLGSPVAKLRERIAETQSTIQDASGATGWEGIIGNIAGSFGVGALGNAATKVPFIGKAFQIANAPAQAYGAVSTATLRFLGKAPVLEKYARAGLEGTRVHRAIGSAVGDLPANILQAVTMPDANAHDIARTLAIGTAGAVVGGALTGKIDFDQPSTSIKPGDFTPSGDTGPRKSSDPKIQSMIDQAESINRWQKANPDRTWADATPAEKAAALGQTGTSVVVREETGLDTYAENLKKYLMGQSNDFDAARKAYDELAKAGVSSETLTSMLGLKAEIINGQVVALVDKNGLSPAVDRLMLASGQAAPDVVIAARVASDSPLNRSQRLENIVRQQREDLRSERTERRRLEREVERDPKVPEVQGVLAWDKARATIENQPGMAVAKYDANNFKVINDARGQDGGDVEIRRIGLVAKEVGDELGIRTFRIGGDEFVHAGPEDLVNFARMMTEARLAQVDAGDGLVYSVSGGIGKNLAAAEADLKPRKVLAKKQLGQPLTRPDEDWLSSATMPDNGVSRPVSRTNDPGVDQTPGSETIGPETSRITPTTTNQRTSEDQAYTILLERFKNTLPRDMIGSDGRYIGDLSRADVNNRVQQIANDLSSQDLAIAQDYIYRALLSNINSVEASNRHSTQRQDSSIDNIDKMKSRWNDIEDRIESLPPGPERDKLVIESAALWNKISVAEGLGTPPRATDPAPARTPPEARTDPATTPKPATGELETITPKKSISAMTADELEDLMDAILKPFDKNPALYKTPQYSAAQRDVKKLNDLLKAIENLPPESRYAMEAPVDAPSLHNLMQKPFDQMTERELGELNVMLQAANNRLPPGDPARTPLVDKLMDLRAWRQAQDVKKATPKPSSKSEDIYDMLKRADLDLKPGRKKKGTEGFTTTEMNASIVATGVGGLLGFSLPAQSEEDRMRNGLIGALALGGATAGTFAAKGKARASELSKLPRKPGEVELDKVMKTSVFNHEFSDLTLSGILGSTVGKLEHFYSRTLRPSLGGEYVARALDFGRKAGKDVGDFLASFGVHNRNTVEWTYHGPRKWDELTQQFIPLTTVRADGTHAQVKSAANILRDVGGDVDTLGKTALALGALEQYAKNGRMPHPGLDPIHLSQFIASVDRKFIDAAEAMRDVHLGLLDLQVQNGIITPEARKVMASERYYTSMERVFEAVENAMVGKNIASKNRGVFSPNPIKARKGPNEYEIRNPVESMLNMIPRVMKAVELQQKKASLIMLWESSTVPDLVKRSFMRPVTITQNEKAHTAAWQQMAKDIKDYMPELDPESIRSMIASYDPIPLGPNSDYMSFIRNGRLESWKLAPDLVETFKYMQGNEIAQVWKVLGVGSNIARTGVAMDPAFIGRMAWFDGFQVYLNTQYGGHLRDKIPGLNWIDALRQSVMKSPEYRNFGGGTAESTMLEGIRTPADVVRRAHAVGDNYLVEAWRHVKELHPIDAYKTLSIPLAEAGRFSEFLAARRHGESVQKALQAATGVAGYYNQTGSMAAGVFHAVPFLRGASQALDQAVYASGLHPFRQYDGNRLAQGMNWFARGTAAISLPTAVLYFMSKDDKEIQDLRQTEFGRRFYFIRNPMNNDIYSIRKPAGPDGQFFSTTVEVFLDKMRGEEPEAFKQWAEAMQNEFSLPWLPPAIQAATAMATGVDVSFGNPIISDRSKGLPTDMMANRNTSHAAQDISKGLVSLMGEPSSDITRRAFSPAGIEYITRTLGGTLAGEALRLADMANSWVTTGSVPAAQEMPIIRKFVSIDMTKQQTRNIEDFYKYVERAERIANALTRTTAESDVDGFVRITNRYGMETEMASILLQTRNQINDLYRAIEELRHFSGDEKIKRQTIINLRQMINDQTAAAVDMYRSAIQD